MPTEIERLYREHRAGLVRLVERELRDHHDAEDVVQTAFLDAQRALERGTIPRHPRAWLATIALNAGRRLRQRSLNAQPLEEYAVQEASEMPEIREALASLPQAQRAAVLYRDVLGLSYGETAVKMGTSVDAVTMLLHRGRSRLRQALVAAAGGIGSWRWAKQGGLSQVAVVKGAAAVVVASGLATTGIVAAHAVAPIGAARTTAAAPAVRSGRPLQEAGPTPGGRVVALDSVRRLKTSAASSVSAALASTQDSGVRAPTASVASTTTEVPPPPASPAASPATLGVPTVSLSTLSIPTPTATVIISTPITTVTVATPTVTTATITTPIVTVTLPIP